MQRRYITVRRLHRPRFRRQSARGGARRRRACRPRRCRRSRASSIIPRRPSCCRRAIPRTTRRCASSPCAREIPFAGHPNVGTAFVLATLAAKPPARLLFEEKAGLVPVEILTEAGQGRRHRADRAAAAEAAVAVQRRAGGGLPFAVGGRYQDGPHPPQIVSVGLPFLVVELASREALRRAQARRCGVRKDLPVRRQRRGLSLYARRAGRRKAVRLQARMFHPGASGFGRSRDRQRHGRRRGAARRSRWRRGMAN